ncbi:hypothetical protein TorRG33x02_256920 [Trema orientale]|uniref:Dentin sialophosphoprotein-like protein n=1 Tax=Trema orientale TaxID=63057 RepID=A0A2P5DAL3_TREOI|nr:hypothetical protein TorRG33x02_256920 [Trema orientale]
MPGNEVGDRVHNFFGQENLSQGQHHSQAIDGNWPGLGNNLWVGGQRQIGGPLISSLKNYNVQQPEDRGHGSQSSNMAHGLNFTQSNLKPEFGRVQSQNQQPALNGYVHGNQVFQTRQNEANFLGVDTETNRHNLMRGLSMSQQGNGPEHNKKIPMRLEASEPPVSFDLFGGQQQMSGQHLNMLQSLPRQQSGNSDMQLLQRHMMLAQLQEFQRRQQLQQLEPRQQSFTNQVSSVVKQAAGNHSPSLINGAPINEVSNNMWQPELVGGNANWLQRGASPVIQGSSSGHMFSPEQGQALRLMDMVPQQTEQSLYGVPISSTSGTPGPYTHLQMDKAAMQHISANNNTLSGNSYVAFPDQVSMQEGTRQDFQGKNIFGSAAGQGLSSGFNLENLQQVNSQQRSPPIQEFPGRQDVAVSPEPSQGKSFTQVTSSQNVATLDPTEEKILFGSDDNIWEAFGGNTNMGIGGYNMLDGTEYFSGQPSVQSGSWSALMQSAVAETSSGDTGIQEEWCGPSLQNSEPPTGNQQPSSVNDGGKSQGVWGDNNFQPAVTSNSRPPPLSVDANRPSSSVNSFSHPQFQQPGFKTSQVQGDKLQSDSSHRFIPKFSEQENQWSDRGPLQKQSGESSEVYASVTHPSGFEPNANNNSGSWTRQQSTSLHNSDTQPYNRSNGWNFIDSMSADGGDNFRSHENKNLLQRAQTGDYKRGMHEQMGQPVGAWRADSTPVSNAELEPVKSAIGSPQVGKEAPGLNNIAVPTSSSVRPNRESKQQLPNSHKLDFWKVGDSSVNSKGGEVLGKNQHNLGKSPQILESSGNNGLDRGVVEMHEADDSNNKSNSADDFRSNVPHHTSIVGSKEDVWSDAGDSRIPGGKQKLSGNAAGRRPSGTRKFQYHPMGDVDVDNEPSYGAKHVTHSQTLPQQVSRGVKGYDQGSSGQSKFVTDRSSLELEGDVQGLDATPSKSMFPGFAPNTSAPFGNYVPHKVPQSSQHMLELLHKVDHPREHGTATRLSSERNMSSEMPEAESSDGSVGHVQRNHSSNSQNFGLQLAPPSQRMSSKDHVVTSQSSPQTVFGSIHGTHDMGEKGNIQMASRASVVPFPSSCETSQGPGNIPSVSGHIGNKASFSNNQGSYSMAFPSGFPYSRNLENQHMHAASGQMMANQSVNIPFNRLSSTSKRLEESSERATQSVPPSVPDMSSGTPRNNLDSSADTSQLNSTDQTHNRELGQQIPESDVAPATQLSAQQGAYSKMSPHIWTNVPRQQPLLAQSSKVASSLFKSHPQSNNSPVTMFPGPPKLNEQEVLEGRSGLSGVNSQSFAEKEQPDKESFGQLVSPDKVDSAQKTLSVLQGKESVVNNFSEVHASHAATQRDIEAFGRSLRPNNSLHQNYSLLHQVQAMKSTDIDSSDRSTKRLKGPDFGVDPEQVGAGGGQEPSYGHNSTERDASSNHTSVPSGDPKILSFSTKLGETRASNASPQDMVAFGRNSSHNFPSNSNAPTISPRMAPSWFDQYGTFNKSGQVLPVYDMQRANTVKSMEQPFIVGKLADDLHARDSIDQGNAAADGGKHGNILQVSTPTSTASEDLTPPHLVPHATDQGLVVVRPKKRKSATSELLPWHKELMKVSQRLRSISMAEADWAQSTNRLPEKVEDEAEIVEDAHPILRPKRRLMLTTQLMQQLLHPPSAVDLSSDATSQYESVAYFTARLSLGDACSAVSCSESEAPSSVDGKNILSENVKTPERRDKYSKVVEDFIGRARKLESELLRLDKRASILDLRVECQDLEKFSVINRFAKFHGRGQADGAETSSTSDGTLNAQKSCPQKYVTALPMPRNLPDRVQCLSL